MSTLFDVTAADVALTNDDWYTPRWMFAAAGITFDMDVAAPIDTAKRTCPAQVYLTPLEDGLTSPWRGVIWCNPPYSRPAPWVDRFVSHPDGMMLVPASNSAWRGRLMAGADALTLVDGEFKRPNGSAGFPYALILAARGAVCVSVLPRIAHACPYAGGAWFKKF